jgi:hypothetical protein
VLIYFNTKGIFVSRDVEHLKVGDLGCLGLGFVVKKQHVVKKRNVPIDVVVVNVARINCFFSIDYIN